MVASKKVQTKTDKLLSELESYLQFNLEPVHPRQEFVKSLRGRLSYPALSQSLYLNEVFIDSKPKQKIPSVVLISAALIGSLIILVAGIKAGLALMQVLKNNAASQYSSDKQLVS